MAEKPMSSMDSKERSAPRRTKRLHGHFLDRLGSTFRSVAGTVARGRALTVAVFSLAIALPMCVSPFIISAAPVSAAAEEETPFTIVSAPDFLNADIGDVRESPLWRDGDPNSINDSITAGLTTVFGEIQGERPDKVLVAGDLVDGHWGQDVEDTGIFGPVGTAGEKRLAIARAGTLYYTQWLRRFRDRGLAVYPAVGDHDIGDNPWAGSPEYDFKRHSMNIYKSTWASVFTRPAGSYTYPNHPASGAHTDTAYAVMLAPEVLLVTVDVFKRTDSDIERTVDGEQLAWLDGVLARAQARGVDWVIVQGHVPTLGPVRYRSSSNMSIAHRADSAFWKSLVRHKVDLYLSGEVHDTSMIHEAGVTQISHGGLFGKSQSSFLVAHFFPDRLELTAKDLNAGPAPSGPRLWATSWRRPRAVVNYLGGTTDIGRLTLTPDQRVLHQSGKLFQYKLTTRIRGRSAARTLSDSSTWQAVSNPSGAAFQFEVKVADGSANYGPIQATPWRPSGELTLRMGDGQTECARVRANHPISALTTPWSPWRCVTSPYDDRALV